MQLARDATTVVGGMTSVSDERAAPVEWSLVAVLGIGEKLTKP